MKAWFGLAAVALAGVVACSAETGDENDEADALVPDAAEQAAGTACTTDANCTAPEICNTYLKTCQPLLNVNGRCKVNRECKYGKCDKVLSRCAAVMANVCAVATGKKAAIADDWSAAPTQFGDDMAAGAAFDRALKKCGTATAPFATRTAAQATLLEAGTNKPKIGPTELLAVPGGPYGQLGARYMDSAAPPANLAAVTTSGWDSAPAFIKRADSSVIVSVPYSELGTGKHDAFLVHVLTEQTTRTPFLNVYGLYGKGTVAGAWFLENKIVPSRATYTKTWYVYEWKDTDAVAGPSAGDTFTLKGSGL